MTCAGCGGLWSLWGTAGARSSTPHPQRCSPGAGGPPVWLVVPWVADAPALALGCLRIAAPTAGVMGWPVLPWQLADGGLQQGQRGGGRGSALAELLNNSPFSTDSSALAGQK